MPELMAVCSFATLQLARFDSPRTLLGADPKCPDHAVMWAVGADEGGGEFEAGTQQAYAWAAFGLHADEQSARAQFDAGFDARFDGADEIWSAVLQPFSHRGEANWLDASAPGQIFSIAAVSNASDPLVVITSVGYVLNSGFDIERAMDFATGVRLVRSSMSAVDGLHSQQSFSFPGIITLDPITVTFWRDDAAMRAFAYRPGEHKTQMDRYRELVTADRTSFTRLRAVASRGTWCGSDPLAWPSPG